MLIGEFSRLVGTSAKTIRYYESIRLLPEAERRGSYRTYDKRFVETVRQIRIAQSLGLSLKQIQSHCSGQNLEFGLPKAVIQQAIQRQEKEINQQIKAAKEKLTQIKNIKATVAASNCA